MTALTKEQDERLIFEELAWQAGLAVVPGSIQQAGPPAPDIACLIAPGDPLAVELVALDDNTTRTRLANMHATDDAWARALDLQSPSDRLRVTAECADMHLSFNLRENLGTRDRAKLFALVQLEILRLPTGYAGELFGPSDYPAGLWKAVAHRGHVTNGPRLFAPSAGSWAPPQYDKLTEKLTRKSYRTWHPMELFAYSRYEDMLASNDVLPEIARRIQADIRSSPFQRVRVFDVFSRRQVYAWP
jgi:hypothetical protein